MKTLRNARIGAPFALLLAAACGTGSPARPLNVAPSARPPAEEANDAPAATGFPEARDFYLHPSDAAGGSYCLDPESRLLRAAVKAPAHRETDPIVARALADDVAFLHDALAKMYAGWPELLQNPTFDVEGFFRDWRQDLLANKGTVSFAKGVLEPNIELRRALNDFHFSVAKWGDKLAADPRLAFVEYQTKSEAATDLASCRTQGVSSLAPGTLRLSSQWLADGSQLPIVTASTQDVGETLRLTCGSTSIELARRTTYREPTPKPTTPLPAYEQRTVGDTTIIKLRQFYGPPAITRLLERFVADAPTHVRSRRIVFDLRGNGGGDDHYVRDWIQRVNRGNWQSYTELATPGGALFPCHLWNAVVLQHIAQDRVDEPSAREERAHEREKWKAPRPDLHVLDPGRMRDDAKISFGGRVFVLVDKHTLSSGESAAYMLHQALHAPIIGERTGGLLQYGNVRAIILPRTQLIWSFATKRNYYDENVEGVGLPVDVYLEQTDAPVETLLPLLRKL